MADKGWVPHEGRYCIMPRVGVIYMDGHIIVVELPSIHHEDIDGLLVQD